MQNIWRIALLVLASYCSCQCHAQRTESMLDKNWKFMKQNVKGAEQVKYDDSGWQTISIPHDWAIFGPFSRDYDLQNVAVTQNGEKKASVKTGRTGGLPYVGIGWYRRKFDVADFDSACIFLEKVDS
jgi:beta-galactosidase